MALHRAAAGTRTSSKRCPRVAVGCCHSGTSEQIALSAGTHAEIVGKFDFGPSLPAGTHCFRRQQTNRLVSVGDSSKWFVNLWLRIIFTDNLVTMLII